MDLVKIDGHSNLVKDRNSGAVLNCDDDALKQAKIARDRIIESKKIQEETQDRLNKVEETLSQVLKMLEIGQK